MWNGTSCLQKSTRDCSTAFPCKGDTERLDVTGDGNCTLNGMNYFIYFAKLIQKVTYSMNEFLSQPNNKDKIFPTQGISVSWKNSGCLKNS